MEALQLLSRNEMKEIKGGYMQEPCQIAWRNADGSFAGYGVSCVSSGDAQNWYSSGYSNAEGQYVSGYCCSSCGSGGFSNAPLSC